jgi:hypothetical protein
MTGIDLWTLDGTDEEVDQVIAVLRFALGAAEACEIVHPETVSRLRWWCNAEYKRLHPPEPTPDPSIEVRAALSRSPYWPFWENLQPNQEVRWTGTKNATYFVVDGELHDDPGSPTQRHTAYIELRRHTGKTFWSHIGKVRPL